MKPVHVQLHLVYIRVNLIKAVHVFQLVQYICTLHMHAILAIRVGALAVQHTALQVYSDRCRVTLPQFRTVLCIYTQCHCPLHTYLRNVTVLCIHIYATSLSSAYIFTQRHCPLHTYLRNVTVLCIHIYATSLSSAYIFTQRHCPLHTYLRNLTVLCIHIYATSLSSAYIFTQRHCPMQLHRQ